MNASTSPQVKSPLATTPLLKISGLCVKYGAINALQNVDLEVRQGEIVAFLGSNGAGKTTTMRTISGLLRPAAGTIEFEGKRIDTLASHEIVKLGISQSPEGRMVFPDLSVKENLLMGAFTRKATAAELNQNLEYIFSVFPRIKERLKQAAVTLSGGEQQMLAISRAYMAQPRLLLLDEPSLGIAPLLTQQIFMKIKELNQGGMTVLLAEQNARMALKIAHRGYVLQVGEVTKSGEAGALARDEDVKKAYLGG